MENRFFKVNSISNSVNFIRSQLVKNVGDDFSDSDRGTLGVPPGLSRAI